MDEEPGNADSYDSHRRLRRVLRWNSSDSRIAHAHCRNPFSLVDVVDNMVLDQQGEEKVCWWVRDRRYSSLGSACPGFPWQRNPFYRPPAGTVRRTKVSLRRTMNVAKTSAPTSDSANSELVKKSFLNASRMMKESGFGLKSDVKVAVDPQLPFMGYSMPLGRGYRVVVSGGSVGSGMLEGLLVHEMSHIYRMENNHVSHDAEVIEASIDKIGKQHLSHDYQQKIIHDLLNDIQDLYADDVSMKVLKKNPILESGQLSSFLQDWVKDEPVVSGDQTKDRWVNASIMVHNARAIGQMTRHGIEDTGGKAVDSNRRFLSRMPLATLSQFQYFQELMVNLKESMTRGQYRKLLADYLNRFLEVAEKN